MEQTQRENSRANPSERVGRRTLLLDPGKARLSLRLLTTITTAISLPQHQRSAYETTTQARSSQEHRGIHRKVEKEGTGRGFTREKDVKSEVEGEDDTAAKSE